MREVISGIYKITNLENGKIYIGKSEDIKTRWNCHEIIHKMKLLKELQSANNVSFELLEKVPLERLNAAEEYYIKSFKSYKPNIGYNVHGKRKLNDEPQKVISIKIGNELHLKLKIFAIEKDITINDLAVEAIEDLLRKYQKGE